MHFIGAKSIECIGRVLIKRMNKFCAKKRTLIHTCVLWKSCGCRIKRRQKKLLFCTNFDCFIYNMINEESNKGRLWKTKFLETCDVT
jgi:hypothetical protein